MSERERARDPDTVTVDGELSACPRCGAERGFHVAFRGGGQRLDVFLVCPACGFRFAVGEWTIATGKPRPFDPKIDAGP